MEKSKLYCQYCKKKGLHNTNRSCREFKGNSDNRDKPGKGTEKTDKPVDKRKKLNKARKASITEIEETPEDEEDEDSDNSVPFIVSRIQWWPLGEADSEGDSEGELESSNDADVFFFDSEFETEDDSSENESGYYTPPNSPEENSLLTEDETEDDNSQLSEQENEDLMPALSSDSESDSDDDDEDSEDDDDVPWTNKLTSNISRKAADGSKDLPGCPGIWTKEETPQDITTAEFQESMQKIFEEISEVMDAQAAERAAREAAASAPPPVRTSTPIEEPELECSTMATPLVENTTSCGEVGEVDFDSEDDAALLKCVELDNEAELLLDRMGEGTKPVFMSSTMLSYLINFPLADKLRKLKLSVKKIFTIEDQENSPDINWGDWMFNNPWVQEEQ